MTATPRAPASMTSSTLSGVMFPMAITGLAAALMIRCSADGPSVGSGSALLLVP